MNLVTFAKAVEFCYVSKKWAYFLALIQIVGTSQNYFAYLTMKSRCWNESKVVFRRGPINYPDLGPAFNIHKLEVGGIFSPDI